MLHDSNTKLLKELMEKFEKLDSKVEKISKDNYQRRRRWWPPNQGQNNKESQEESIKDTSKSKEVTEKKPSLNE